MAHIKNQLNIYSNTKWRRLEALGKDWLDTSRAKTMQNEFNKERVGMATGNVIEATNKQKAEWN